MTAEQNQPRFLTMVQVADELNVKQSLVQGLIRTGELRAFQIGGRGCLARPLRLMKTVGRREEDAEGNLGQRDDDQ